MERREFICKAANAVFAGVIVDILGCSDSANYASGLGSGPGGTAGPGDRVALIAAPDTPNHSVPGQHVAIMTEAEISRGKFLILSIRGYANHEHTIALSEAEQRDIANGLKVSKPSTDTNGHYHTVTFN